MATEVVIENRFRVENERSETRIAAEVPSIGVVITKYASKYGLHFSDARSVQEALNNLDKMGSEDEVITIVRLNSGGGDSSISDQAAINALEALVAVNEEQEDSICQTLERLLIKVFLAGVSVGKQRQ